MKLSILIYSVFEQQDKLNQLLTELDKQIGDNQEIEVLVLIDNKRRSIKTKRDNLINSAQGDYVVFIDDHDHIGPNYVFELLKGIKSEADCICFNVLVQNLTTDLIKVCKYAPHYLSDEDIHYYYRKPNHTMCFKKSFTDDIKSFYFIDKILYYTVTIPT